MQRRKPSILPVVLVDLAFGDDFLEQNRSWDDFGTTISGNPPKLYKGQDGSFDNGSSS